MGRRRWIPVQIAILLVALVCAGVAIAAKNPRPARQTMSGLATGAWRTWWGNAGFNSTGVTLSSTVPTSPDETHSALITTRQTWRDQTISTTTSTLAQLRTGSAPNVWEVGWVMFRFRDLENYYYFILKTNGFELGKKQGSDTQIFLATGNLPAIEVGPTGRHIEVRAQGPRIRVFVDGSQLIDFTDPNPLLGAGSVGLYEEDSRARFDSFSVS
jgi:hypothetical protein